MTSPIPTTVMNRRRLGLHEKPRDPRATSSQSATAAISLVPRSMRCSRRCGSAKPIVQNQRQAQLEQASSLFQGDAEFQAECPHLIDETPSRADHLVAHPMQRLEVRLFLALDRSKQHCWSRGRFCDGLGDDDVALARLHEQRRDRTILCPGACSLLAIHWILRTVPSPRRLALLVRRTAEAYRIGSELVGWADRCWPIRRRGRCSISPP